MLALYGDYAFSSVGGVAQYILLLSHEAPLLLWKLQRCQLTLAGSRPLKREHSGRWKASSAGPCVLIGGPLPVTAL